ncbi:MAG TPA: DOMON-like domain-containing protein [Vitreimonas sp.]|uniref:DOMON-like domain-containing protein n=1 Tax=Vitreimonas sp. TaxID=3069702 RepID=UPI002D73B57E|nr:DOMON-like domain-containing protein [Vitreimonas sp.]HYD88411.1 DOMON-like domain-containing protein [Vitreimonas sp.]
MRRVILKPHPETPARAVSAVEAEVHAPSAGQVRLRFEVRGALESLQIPAPADPERTDELWKHTCFEVFARVAGAEGYDEFNFSPSTQWAVYRFDGYRAGMMKPEVLAPRVEGGIEGDAYVLHAAFDLPGMGPWRVGLAAVMEEAEGTKSYWALTHPPGKPDFHHADAFVFELRP